MAQRFAVIRITLGRCFHALAADFGDPLPHQVRRKRLTRDALATQRFTQIVENKP
jgi:hypothetical protein